MWTKLQDGELLPLPSSCVYTGGSWEALALQGSEWMAQEDDRSKDQQVKTYSSELLRPSASKFQGGRV